MVASARSGESVTAAAYAKGGGLDKELLIWLIEYGFVQHDGKIGSNYLLNRSRDLTHEELIMTARFAYETAVENFAAIAIKLQGLLAHVIGESAEILENGLRLVGEPGIHMEAMESAFGGQGSFDQLRRDMSMAWMSVSILQRHLARHDELERILGGRRD